MEIVRRATAAYNRRDSTGSWRTGHPTPSLTGPALAALMGVYRGHDEIGAFVQRFFEAWDEVRSCLLMTQQRSRTTS